MNARDLLGKYYSRLTREGIIRALLAGFLLGFAVLLLTSTVWWFVGLKFVWLCAILFVLTTAVATPIFYYKTYRPTVRQTARRVDALGLEERLLTMAEFENDTSFIASKQREDAARALQTVNERLLKLIISVSAIVVFGVVSVFGMGMVTVATLQEHGVIRSGWELLVDAATPAANEYKIIYQVQGDGTVEGASSKLSEREVKINGVLQTEIYQIVKNGEDAKPVIAVASDNWIFIGWADEYGEPYRLDKKIDANMTLVAVFQKIDDVDDPAIEGEADEAGIATTGNDGPPPESGDSGNDGGDGGGRYEDHNMVLDGKIYYGDYYQTSLEDALSNIANNGGSSEQVGVVDDYFKIIER